MTTHLAYAVISSGFGHPLRLCSSKDRGGFTLMEVVIALGASAVLAFVLTFLWGALISSRLEHTITFNGTNYNVVPSKPAMDSATRTQALIRDLLNGRAINGKPGATEFYVFGAKGGSRNTTTGLLEQAPFTDASVLRRPLLNSTAVLNAVATISRDLPPHRKGNLELLATRLGAEQFMASEGTNPNPSNNYVVVAIGRDSSGTVSVAGWARVQVFSGGNAIFYNTTANVGGMDYAYAFAVPAGKTAGAATICATAIFPANTERSLGQGIGEVPTYALVFPDPDVSQRPGRPSRFSYTFNGLR